MSSRLAPRCIRAAAFFFRQTAYSETPYCDFFVLQKCAGLFHEINRAHDAAMHMQLILGCGGQGIAEGQPKPVFEGVGFI